MGIDELLGPAAVELMAVDSAIREALDSGDRALASPAAYLFDHGGKRIRPALVILSALCYRYDARRVIPAAAAVEMIHTASLIHDDIMDGATMRRGAQSVHTRWGMKTALLAGDYLFARAFLMLSGAPPAALAGLARAAQEMCAGQAKEFGAAGYFERIQAKTAAFLSECCRLGSILGHAPPAAVRALAEYGRLLGIAFQVTDDMLDVFGDPVATGKPAGSDLREGLLTLPIMRCIHSSPKGPRLMELVEALARQRTGDAAVGGELAEALEIIRESDSREYCSRVAGMFARRAAACLGGVRPCAARASLEGLAGFVAARAC